MTAAEILRTLLVGFPPPPEMINPGYPEFIQKMGGLQLTLTVTSLGLFFGTFVGIALAVLRGGKVQRTGSGAEAVAKAALGWISLFFTETIRGIPIMIFVLLTYYLPYPLFGVRVPAAVLAVAAFTLYAGVYLGEIFRSGFRAVQEEIIDSARVLGLSRSQVLFEIKLPIALRTMAPDMLGVAITVFKDTSVLMVVGVADMSYTARQIQAAEPVNYLLVLALLLFIYWSIAFVASLLAVRIETLWKGDGQKELTCH